MRMILVLFSAILLGAMAHAEVAHDPTQCPDLSGQFVIPDKTFGDMNFTIEMTEKAGIKTMIVTNEDDKTVDTVEITGIQTAATGGWSSMAACSNQHIYLYEYENSVVQRTSGLSLLANTDLFIEMEDKDGASEITAKRR